MSEVKKNKDRVERRKLRVRSALRKLCSNNKIRISVFRSLNYISAQAINDQKAITVAYVSSKDTEKNNKVKMSYDAGILLGNKLLQLGYNEIVFDRGAYLYHGRVKAFSDGIRAVGIKF